MSADSSAGRKEPRLLRTNPYVGLTPFDREDSLYFFGRREQATALLGILAESRFLPVVGGSGSGKSSLVRAGLIPQLDAGFLVHDSDHWRIAIMRPGDGPIANLAAALAREFEDRRPQAAATLTEDIGRRRAEAIVEYVRERQGETSAREREQREERGEPLRARKENLLILADQFEEVFSFRLAKGRANSDNREDREEFARRNKEAADFVDTLLKVAAQDDVPIHVVITMRTDFLGDCDLFFGLPEAMNAAQYLIPRMSRQALRQAVSGPPQIFGAIIAPRLVDKVLNDLGARQDRLPVLQHALLRTWDAWDAAGRIGPLDLEHFSAAGGLDKALAQDADAAARGFDEGVVARIFRALTDTDLQERRIRRPAFVDELEAVAGAPPATVRAIIDSFKGTNRNFLYESVDAATGRARIDISHESLIRQWKKLADWVDQERDARTIYLKLVDKARDGWPDHRDPLAGTELARAVAWKAEFDPQEAWAKRYERNAGSAAASAATPGTPQEKSAESSAGDVQRQVATGKEPADYALTMDFIETSATLAKRSRQIRRNIVAAAVTILAALSLTAARQAWNAIAAREEALDLTKLSIANQLVTSDPSSAAVLALDLKMPAGFDIARAALLQKVAASAIPSQILERVAAAAIDRGGSHVAVAHMNGMIELLDLGAPGHVTVLRDSSRAESFTSIAFSRDGRFLAAGTATGEVMVLPSTSRSKPVSWRTNLKSATNVAFDASGAYVMAQLAHGAEDDMPAMFVWETKGEAGPRLRSDACLTRPKFSPTQAGLLVATCLLTAADTQQAQVPSRIIQLTTSSFTTKTLPGPSLPIDFSGDGRFVLITREGSMTSMSDTTFAELYDVASGAKQLSVALSGFVDPVVNRDGTMLVVVDGADIVVHRPGLPEGETRIEKPTGGAINALHGIDEDASHVLVQGESNIVRLVNVVTGDATSFKGHTDEVRSATIVAGDVVLTVGEDNTARVWKPPFRRDRVVLPQSESPPIWSDVAHSGARLFNAYLNGDAIVQDLTGARAMRQWNDTAMLRGTFDNRGDYLAIVRKTGAPIVRGPRNTVVQLEEPGEDLLSQRVGFTPDSRIVFASGTTHAILWDRTTGRVIGRPIVLASHEEEVISAADAQSFVTRIHGRGLRIRHAGDDVATARILEGVTDGGLSEDGRYFMAIGANAALYSVRGGKLREMKSRKSVTSWSFSHDGKRLVTGTRNFLVNIWPLDTLNKEPPIVLHGHTGAIIDVEFSLDDSLIVSTSEDGTARIWSAYGKGQPIVLHPANVRIANFTAEQSLVTTGDRAILWTLQPARLRAVIDSAANFCLTEAFRMETLGENRNEARKSRDKCERRHGRTPPH